jgi:hypothetical protein
MSATILRFPVRPLASQRALADVDAALAANDFERSETLYAMRRLEERLRGLREDLEGLEDDRLILELERVAAVERVNGEASGG